MNAPGAGLTIQQPNAVGSASLPTMRLVSNQELDAMAKAKEEQSRNITPLNSLTSHIRRCWEVARRAKEPVQKEILRDYRQRNGEYEADVLAAIQAQGGSAIYMMLTALKCRSLEAWIADVEMPADDTAWEIEPTEMPDLPPELEQRIQAEVMNDARQAFELLGGQLDPGAVQQRIEELREEVKERADEIAKKAAEGMTGVIEDDLQEGHWEQAFSDCLYDFTTTKACIIHGPVLRKRKSLRWKQDPERGHVPVEEMVIKKEYERRSPLDIYPSPDSTGPDDGFLFDHQRPTPSDLYSMMGVPGFNEQTIKAVLDEYGRGGLREWMWHDMERAEIEQKHYSLADNAERRIDMLVYNGPVSGRLLGEWGFEGMDPYEEFEVQAFLIGRHLIGVKLNKNPGGKRPYSVASLEEIPGAFWGNGLAYMLKDLQQMCNAAARAISNNMGIASGPQVVVNDLSRIPENEDVTSMYPWKIWQFMPDKSGATSHRPPIDFFQPSSMTAELMAVYDKFAGMADEFIPSYMNGNQNIGGAGRTATGLSMLMGQATKTVKRAIGNLDRGVVNRVIYMTYLMEMLFNEDPSIKGDLRVIPRGAISLLAKEQQQIRRSEFLQATANQFDIEIMGKGGRATLLRENAKSLDLPVDKVVPDEDDIGSLAMQHQVQQQVMAVVGALAEGLGVPPESLMQVLQQGQGQPQGGGMQAPATLDAAGNPAGGSARLF
jgi:hypothetical protein